MNKLLFPILVSILVLILMGCSPEPAPIPPPPIPYTLHEQIYLEEQATRMTLNNALAEEALQRAQLLAQERHQKLIESFYMKKD